MLCLTVPLPDLQIVLVPNFQTYPSATDLYFDGKGSCAWLVDDREGDDKSRVPAGPRPGLILLSGHSHALRYRQSFSVWTT
jgi:hypothetical protein